MIYNRKLNRCQAWNYSNNGYYFVTICAGQKGNIFGEVIKGNMILNDKGKIVWRCWRELPKHYINCHLNEFIIMPDHVHGIVVISDVGKGLQTLPNNGDRINPKIGGRAHGLSEIIRGFKTYSSRKIHDLGVPDFHWHNSFFDEIIRDKRHYLNITQYIKDNPKNWIK